ncbi:MAG: acyloxyacyl hydrolase [Desulfobacteraceae bacterium]
MLDPKARVARALVVALLLFPCLARAADTAPDASSLYTRDRISLQVVTGPISSTSLIGPDIPDFNYWHTGLRLGWMFTSPKGDGRGLDGNFEALLEFSNAFVYEGFGDYIGGLSGIIRYNFTSAGSRFIPYVQAGLGFVYTDAYQDETQDAIGQAFNFFPQAGAGFRYLLTPNWSLDAEMAFQHISNGGMDERNDGVNALGMFVGVTYFWDDVWR